MEIEKHLSNHIKLIYIYNNNNFFYGNSKKGNLNKNKILINFI